MMGKKDEKITKTALFRDRFSGEEIAVFFEVVEAAVNMHGVVRGVLVSV